MHLYSYKLSGDQDTISTDDIERISEITRRSHQIHTRVLRADSDPMVKSTAALPTTGTTSGALTTPFFWARWSDEFWEETTFDIESGSIDESLTDETTRSLSLTVHSDHWTTPGELLRDVSPFHTLLRVERGIEIVDADLAIGKTDTDIVWIPLGIFRVHGVQLVRDHTAEISGMSMEEVIKNLLYDKIPAPLSKVSTWKKLFDETSNPPNQGGDWSYLTSQFEMTKQARESVQSESYPADFDMPTGYNRWGALNDMLTKKGLSLMVNRVGKPVIVKVPTPFDSYPPDIPQKLQDQLQFAEGQEGVLISRSEEYSRDGVFSAVVAYGNDINNEDRPFVTTVTDSEPASLTYVGGPFGRAAIELNHGEALSEAEIRVAAQERLRESKILKTNTNLDILPNPTVEAGDRIRINYPDGTHKWFVIQSVTIPLTAEESVSVSAYTYDNARTDPALKVPGPVTVENKGSTSVTLVFPRIEDISHYEWAVDKALLWNPISATGFVDPTTGVKMARIKIENLRPLTEYNFEVRTVRSNEDWDGRSNPSASVHVKTTAPPPIIRKTHVGRSSIKVTWDYVPGVTEYIDHYEYRVNGGGWQGHITAPLPADPREVAITGLKSSTDYTIEIRAVNPGVGTGAPEIKGESGSIRLRTLSYWAEPPGTGVDGWAGTRWNKGKTDPHYTSSGILTKVDDWAKTRALALYTIGPTVDDQWGTWRWINFKVTVPDDVRVTAVLLKAGNSYQDYSSRAFLTTTPLSPAPRLPDGGRRAAIVNEARKGLGKCESRGGHARPYTNKIGPVAWCGGFTEYVYRVAAGINLTGYSSNPYYISTIWSDMQRRGLARNKSTAMPGDLVFFRWPGAGRVGHIGIVESASGGSITTIEGNTSNCVRRKHRGGHVVGVASPGLSTSGGSGGSGGGGTIPPPDTTPPPAPVPPVGMEYGMNVDAGGKAIFKGAAQAVGHNGVIGWSTKGRLKWGQGDAVHIYTPRGNYCLDTVTVVWEFAGRKSPP